MDSQERQLAIHPYAPESLQSNAKALYQIRSVTSTVFGISAGILGLEAIYGFVFYFAGTILVSLLCFLLLTHGKPGQFFLKSSDVWTRNAFTGLSSFVLTWTLFYGLVDA
ncbi:Rab5-interacting protein-domain-containing protein [Lipomyces japonicus]|uniref:Rab5-interacting protein-domain-containing protein n=1 Tax=Lipomyces japonicus TaxID=56871 RepID=UPI0034CF1A2C